jgi:hypothetical protein
MPMGVNRLSCSSSLNLGAAIHQLKCDLDEAISTDTTLSYAWSVATNEGIQNDKEENNEEGSQSD